MKKFLDWLDKQNDAIFLAVLYLVRLPIIWPVGLVQEAIAKTFLSGTQPRWSPPSNPLAGFMALIIWAPLTETVVECTIPYSIMRALDKIRSDRPWNFILIAGAVMAVGHIPIGIPAGFVTGMFLGYCYAHFAVRSQWVAFAYASLYHAAINIVGWIMVYIVGVQL